VKQATQEVASVHPGSPSLADQGQTGGWTRRFQPKRSVWTVPVVVLDVDPEDLLQATTADDQQPVEALGTDRTDPTLGVGIRVRRLDRRHQHLGTLGAEHLVEPVTKLGVAVAEHKAQSLSSIRCRQEQVAGLLGDPGTMGVDVTPARWTRRVASSMKNSTYSRRSQMVSTVKNSQARMPAACWCRNARHVVVVGRRRVQPMTTQRGTDRGCRDPHAEPEQLALMRW
jgi:hypothetical protein